MLVEALDKRLRSEYDLVCFEDMADVLAYHSTLFRLMTSLFRDRYEDNERLVFYTAEEPTQLQIDHIQRAAARTDISNFFILLVCPFDLTQKIENSNRKFGHDGSLIQSLMISLENTKPFGPSRLVPTDSLCALPFVQTNISTDGKVNPCCKFNSTIGDLRLATLDQIWRDSKLELVRQDMREGKRSPSCSVCWQNEDAGTTSYRQLAWHKYGAALDHGWLDDVQIRDVTWAPTSLCNFACRICSPEFSTKIATEEIKFAQTAQTVKEIKNIISMTNDPGVQDTVFSSLDEMAHLKHLHVLGGEPFLWPGLSKLIDTLVLNDTSHEINLEINTNCSVYPEDKIQRILENFNAVQILMSIDNIGMRFEIERGGQWQHILKNMEKFARLRSTKCEIQLAVTINLQNLLYLDDMIQLAESMSVPILWWYLEDPDFLCIDRATESLKKKVVDRYHNHADQELRLLARRVAHSSGSNGQEFLSWCHKMDIRRGQRFADSHAEVYAAMGG